MPIRFEDVSYFYTTGKQVNIAEAALKNINLSISENKITAIIGHTGSGKSTLIQHLNALLIPKSGNVIIDEFTITPIKKKNKKLKILRKKVGVVFQFPEYQLFEETIYKDVAFGPKNFGVEEKEIDFLVRDSLHKVGIDETYFDTSPFEISGGQKRRVAIAGILALNPDVLVLDEPTAGLDPKGANEIMELLNELNKTGKTIIIVSHDMDYIIKYADECVVLSEGKLMFHGKPSQLFSDEKLLRQVQLQAPLVYQFAHKLKQKGINLNLDKIIDLESLALAISEVVK